MMKKLLTAALSLFMLVSIGCASEDSELVWVENLEEAVVQAKEENKNILVNFTGSDWCGWCIKLR
jgi:protein disulfide-isomerase